MNQSNLDFFHCAKLAVCFVVMVGLLPACEEALPPADNSAPSPSNDYALSDSELKNTTISAKKGDVRAMLRLADYYLIYKDGLDDEKAAFYWLEQAGDAGNAGAREFLLAHYAEDGTPARQKYGESLKNKWGVGKIEDTHGK